MNSVTPRRTLRERIAAIKMQDKLGDFTAETEGVPEERALIAMKFRLDVAQDRHDRMLKTLTETQAECNRLLEENRRLRAVAQSYARECENLQRDNAWLDAGWLVSQFHAKHGVPLPQDPGFPPQNRIDQRARLIAEEFCEFLKACGYSFDLTIEKLTDAQQRHRVLRHLLPNPEDPNFVEAIDALADLEYVLHGTALELGVELAPIVAEVHRSNMTKVCNVDDRDSMTKGPEYDPPAIVALLKLQGWNERP